jgi:cytochrome c oxidase subunit IV
MTEVIAALIAPILILFFLIMITERIFSLFVRSAQFIEGLNR